MSPRRWTSSASSAATRVRPIPGGPVISTSSPRPPAARSQRASSQSSSAVRPRIAGRAAAASSSGSSAGCGVSRGSCRRIASCRSRSSGPGSTPSSPTSRSRASWIGVERLGLAAAAVEREHQLRGEALVRRVLGHQPAQLADDLGVPAGGDVGLDAARERGDPRLLEAAHLAGCERLVRQVAERRAAPQAERLAQQLRRGLRPAGRQLAPAARDELVEALHVALAGADAEPVPGRGPRHRVAVAERLAQPRDVDLHGLDRPGRRVRAPQRERQPLGADRLVRIQEKDGEDRSRLGSTERDRAVGAADLQRSQDVELHRPRRNATFRRVALIGRSRLTHRRAGRAERPGTTARRAARTRAR